MTDYIIVLWVVMAYSVIQFLSEEVMWHTLELEFPERCKCPLVAALNRIVKFLKGAAEKPLPNALTYASWKWNHLCKTRLEKDTKFQTMKRMLYFNFATQPWKIMHCSLFSILRGIMNMLLSCIASNLSFTWHAHEIKYF